MFEFLKRCFLFNKELHLAIQSKTEIASVANFMALPLRFTCLGGKVGVRLIGLWGWVNQCVLVKPAITTSIATVGSQRGHIIPSGVSVIIHYKPVLKMCRF